MFKISSNVLFAQILNKDMPKEDLNKTNIIDTRELVFSEYYIKQNLDLVSSFLNVIIIKRKISKVIVKDFEIIGPVLDIIKSIPNIKELSVVPDVLINYDTFLKLLENNYLKKIDCYDFPKILLDRLDVNKNIEIKTRTEILFVSNFMKINNLNTYSDIYYKKSIVITNPFKKEDLDDYITFIKINNHLKEIDFKDFDQDAFFNIMNILLLNSKKNIKVILHDFNNLNEVINNVSKFKKENEKKLIENNINFKINYSDEYKKNNFLKQLNLNFLKISLGGVIIVLLIMIGINYYKNYVDEQNYLGIENNLKEIIKNNQAEKEEIPDIDIIEPDENDTTTTSKTTTVYDIQYEKVFSSLLEINKDTTGWITVNNTKIDYPVVQAKDNDYYLKRDYNGVKNRHGWIFMDYRNNIDELDENTIIYGHNLANQTMFGTLRYALNHGWYTKSKNQVITFNTLKSNMKWQIFSVYTIPVTNDYLDVTFATTEQYQNFIDMITARSIYDFQQTVTTNDKILTLSTCANGHDNRLVVHAKLIQE